MASLDIGWILRQRADSLKKNNPDLEAEWEVEDSDWGLITLRQGGDLIGFEFVESEDSWTRPDALLQYREAANEGYYVAVVVPDESLEQVIDLIYSMGEEAVTLLSYSTLGLQPMITP